MSTITLRSTKGSPLTNTEVDNNFTNLNNDKYQSGDSASFSGLAVDSSTASSTALVATFRAGGDDNDNRANVFIGQDSNSRGLLIRAGRESGDRAITQFMLNSSGGVVGSSITNALEFYEVSGGAAWETTFNQSSKDIDFRIESDNNSTAFVVQGSDGSVGIGAGAPKHPLHVTYSATGGMPSGGLVQTANGNVSTFYNASNSATYSGIQLETRTSLASCWQILNEWKEAYLGDLVIRGRDGGSSSSEMMRISSDGNITLAGSTKRDWFTGTHEHTALQLSSWSSISGRTNDIDLAVNNNCYTSSYNVWTKPSRWQSSQMFMVNNADIVFRKSPTFTQEDFDADPTITWEGTLSLYEGSSGAVFNESSLDRDFRVESNNKTHMLFVDGGANAVGVGAVPSYTFDVAGTGRFTGRLRVDEPIWAYSDSGVRHYTHLATGQLYNATGVVILTTNIPGHNQSGNGNMFAIRISGYSYSNKGPVDFWIGCYSGENGFYSPYISGKMPTAWHDKAWIYTDANGKVAFQFGDSTTDTQACEIAVAEFVQGFQNQNPAYSEGWTVTTATTIPSTQTNKTALTPYSYHNGYLYASHGAVFNDLSSDDDFRVESNNNAFMLHVDGGGDYVGIGTNATGPWNQTAQYSWDVNTGGTFLNVGGTNAGQLNLRKGTTTNGDLIGGIWFTNSSNQSDAHRQVAGISSKAVVSSSYPTLGGAHLDFWTKPATAGVTGPRMRLSDAGRLSIGTTGDNSSLFRLVANSTSLNQTAHISAALNGSGDGLVIDATTRTGDDNSLLKITRDTTGTLFDVHLGGNVTVNDRSSSSDFRVESNNNSNMLFVDGGNDRVGVGNSDPQVPLDVSGVISSRVGPYGAYSTGLLEIASSESSPQIKIITNIKYQGTGASVHAHSVKISGFAYGSTATADVQVSWHVWNNTFYNATATSSGGWAPTVTLAVENNYVVIHLTSPGYWPKMCVESMYNAFGYSDQARGWSWSNSAVSADANTPVKTVPYKNNFGNGHYLDGNIAVFNDNSADCDFRVESNDNTHMLFVDGGNNVVVVNGTATTTSGLSDAELTTWGRSSRNVYKAVIQASGYGAYVAKPDGHNNWYFAWMSNSSGGGVGNIYVNGSGTTYNTTSDRRLKDNIETITDGTDKLMAMNPVTHTWKADPDAPAVHGFIAQEMQDVVPEAVSGEDGGEEMMSMDYGRITPVIVAALQDAHREIQNLKAEIAALKGDK